MVKRAAKAKPGKTKSGKIKPAKAKSAGPVPRLTGAMLGPLVYLRRSWPRALFLLVLCSALTLLTQIGGLILWLSIPFLAAAAQRLRKWGALPAALETITLFVLIYGLASLLLVPPLAALGGRVPLPCFGDSDMSRARSVLYCALNRHYVRRDVRELVERMAADVTRANPGVQVRTLDAGFPFIDGFPMLPHLGHRHGTAVDLALFYRDPQGRPAPSPSPLGYGAYAQPRGGAQVLDEAVTRDALRWLAQQPGVGGEGGVRFRDGAARHDDHIHVQVER